jgi:hypothetical protein
MQVGIDTVRGALGYDGPSSVDRLGSQPGGVDFTDARGRGHILEGEGVPGEGRGRHAYGGGEPSSYPNGRFRPVKGSPDPSKFDGPVDVGVSAGILSRRAVVRGPKVALAVASV